MSADVIYYNISIDNTSPQTSGITHGAGALPIVANVQANNNSPVLQNPDEYIGSIIRFSVPCFTVPLIQFLVETPLINPADVNKGIYTFTLEYNGIYSSQTNYIYSPQITDAPVPKTPSALQDFSSYYYFVYNYSVWIGFQNTALSTAFTELQGLVGGALAGCQVPFFNYDPTTQLITLYADKAFFDQSLTNHVKIYFNTVSQQYFNGFLYNENTVGSANGIDAYFVIKNLNGLNTQTINGSDYLKMTQEFVSLAYLSPLKNILITSSMNINSEVFYISNPSATQNNNFVNVLTDFIPDLSGVNEAGIGSKIFIYNAPSLYRVFNFKDKSPLYSIQLGISWLDQLGNVYPLPLTKGTIATIKLMFIKKSAFNNFSTLGSQVLPQGITHNIRYKL